MDKDLIRLEAPQVPPYDPSVLAQGLMAQFAHFLCPLLVELDRLPAYILERPSSHSPDFAVPSVACGKITLLTSLHWRAARQIDAAPKQPSGASSG